MRVTKAIREYIKKQVESKIAKKYEWEKNEVMRIQNLRDDIIERAQKAAVNSAMSVLSEAKEYPDIFGYSPEKVDKLSLCGYQYVVYVKNRYSNSSIYNWDERMDKEVDEIVQNIVLELELGGNKEALERLLADV